VQGLEFKPQYHQNEKREGRKEGKKEGRKEGKKHT
jgi:flagellar biosynthesis/type III secretory pathway protein FliH